MPRHLLFLLLLLGAVPVQAQNDADSAAVRQAALDYIEGWYTGDAARMERALHPELAKRRAYVEPQTGRPRLDQQSALTLVQGTRAGYGTQVPASRRSKEITVLDLYENAASVKIVASDWVDYLHLVRWDGSWRIVNVLWELKP